jgi:hypothetical protein
VGVGVRVRVVMAAAPFGSSSSVEISLCLDCRPIRQKFK